MPLKPQLLSSSTVSSEESASNHMADPKSVDGNISPTSITSSLQNQIKTMHINDKEPTSNEQSTIGSLADLCPFNKVMAANRGEISIRTQRAATELNLTTVSIYAYEGEHMKLFLCIMAHMILTYTLLVHTNLTYRPQLSSSLGFRRIIPSTTI